MAITCLLFLTLASYCCQNDQSSRLREWEILLYVPCLSTQAVDLWISMDNIYFGLLKLKIFIKFNKGYEMFSSAKKEKEKEALRPFVWLKGSKSGLYNSCSSFK